MGRVLAISSQVARGAIGLSAAAPALQTLGHEVVTLPTILLSNHPGHVYFAAERVSPALLGRMLDSLDANGWLGEIDAVLSGYLPSAEHVAFAESAVDRVKRRSPSALYLCDPILGDDPKGLYIAPDAADAIRDRLVPRAAVLKMNQFEAGWLARSQISCIDDAVTAARDNGWKTAIVTSLPASDAVSLSNVLVDGHDTPLSIDVERRERVPKGTGDLFGALWLGHRLRSSSSAEAFERAVSGVELVVSRSLGRDELQLATSLRDLAP